MSRLFVRIFVVFWLVIALVLTGVWLVNAQLAELAADERTQRERVVAERRQMLESARHSLASGGEAALAQWADRIERRSAHRVFVVTPAGVELRGRELPPAIARIAERRQARGRRGGPDAWLGRGMLLGTLDSDAGPYLVAVHRAPEHWLLRLLGPLGPAGVIALALGISALMCLWLAHTLTRPIVDLQRAGRRLGAGDLSARASAASAARRDEIGVLAADFNRMAQRLEAVIGSQRRLLRDVSHELRSPLARLQVALELAAGASDDETRATNIERMRRDAARLEALIAQVLDYTRIAGAAPPPMAALDLAELADDVVESAALEGGPRAVRVVRGGAAAAPVTGNRELLLRTVENVVRNAVRHSPDGGTVDVVVERDGAHWTVTVADEGPGVPPGLLTAIFEPFVRVSDERGERSAGGGVGLAIAREAVQLHDGRIRAENRRDRGLTVAIELPVDHS